VLHWPFEGKYHLQVVLVPAPSAPEDGLRATDGTIGPPAASSLEK
jgi:hypothetical protein